VTDKKRKKKKEERKVLTEVYDEKLQLRASHDNLFIPIRNSSIAFHGRAI